MMVICLHCNEEFDLERWAESPTDSREKKVLPKISDVEHCPSYRVAMNGAAASDAQKVRLKRLEGFVGCPATPVAELTFGAVRKRINELERTLIASDKAAQ